MSTFTHTSYGIVVEDENLARKAEALKHAPLSFDRRYQSDEAKARWLKAIHKQLMLASMPAEFHQRQARRNEVWAKLYGNPQLAKAIPEDEREVLDMEQRALDHWLLDTLVKYRQQWTPRNRALVVVEG